MRFNEIGQELDTNVDGVAIVVQDDREDARFAADIYIDPSNVQGEYLTIAPLLGTYSERYVEFDKQHERLKALLERVTAARYLEIRDEMLDAGAKPTEEMLKNKVKADEMVFTLRNWVITAEAAANIAKVRAEALRCKRDSLVSYGAMIRAELQGDPSLRASLRTQTTQRSQED